MNEALDISVVVATYTKSQTLTARA